MNKALIEELNNMLDSMMVLKGAFTPVEKDFDNLRSAIAALEEQESVSVDEVKLLLSFCPKTQADVLLKIDGKYYHTLKNGTEAEIFQALQSIRDRLPSPPQEQGA